MKAKRRTSKPFDANFQLPDDKTQELYKLLLELPPSDRRDYLLENVLSKFVSKDTDPAVVRRNRAINKWLGAEAENAATNTRLLTILPDYNILPGVGYEVFMDRVRTVVCNVIGDVPPDVTLIGSFSGGATTSKPRTSSFPAAKYTGEAHVTKRAYPYALDLVEGSHLWREAGIDITIVPGNELFTVPKNAEIDRCACKEPDLNMFLQKGAGAFIRHCLLKEGINLNDQSINKALAQRGSIDGSLATIDLSSASDTISREFVFQALPISWFCLLDDIRSPVTVIDGEEHELEMFSSMGNGFTFELESLLFYAVARAVAWSEGIKGTLSVYGDDIVCPTPMATSLFWVLNVLGFSVNTEKSFYDGPFRESCGGHFLSGHCVTPFYVRAPIARVSDAIKIANEIRTWAGNISGIADPLLYPAWRLIADQVPKMFWGGHDCEDTTRLVSSWKPRQPRRLKEVSPKSLTGYGGYLHWLCTKERRPNEDLETSSIASSTGRYRATKVAWDYRVTDVVFLQELSVGDDPVDWPEAQSILA